MRTLSFLIGLLFSANVWANQGFADIGAIATNPAANAVLAPAVTLTGGGATGSNWAFNVMVSSTVSATVVFQVLNASAVVQQSLFFIVPANTSFTWSSNPVSFKIPNGWSVRVINNASITGSVQASIFYASEGDY